MTKLYKEPMFYVLLIIISLLLLVFVFHIFDTMKKFEDQQNFKKYIENNDINFSQGDKIYKCKNGTYDHYNKNQITKMVCGKIFSGERKQKVVETKNLTKIFK